MGLPRTFVGFSSTDISQYRLMQAWKANEKIDFDFADCQLDKDVRSEDEAYIKGVCRQRINMAGYFIQLIGADTASKYKYVRWEAEVAIEKGCKIIGVNLDGNRDLDSTRTPTMITDVGAIFVAFTPKIIKFALEDFTHEKKSGNLRYTEATYAKLGLG